jgi:His-Xaa-Ser system protein HxsD
MEEQCEQNLTRDASMPVRVSHDLVSVEALLKTCYWFSRDFICDVQDGGDRYALVLLKRKRSSAMSLEEARDQFMAQAFDFALRERVTAKTANVRDLLIAKAFSESGVLEEKPRGKFGDAIEEAKTDGMFKILGNF